MHIKWAFEIDTGSVLSANYGILQYPTGRRRLPVLGVVIFSVVMITAFFQVLVESIKQLFSKDLALVVLPISVAITMAATVAIKLAVWISYRHFRDQSIQALSQDAMNDVVFSIFSIIFPFVDSLFGVAYLDPLGAALLSIYIIKEWAETLYTCVNDLIGCRADPIQHNVSFARTTEKTKLSLSIFSQTSACHIPSYTIFSSYQGSPTCQRLQRWRRPYCRN